LRAEEHCAAGDTGGEGADQLGVPAAGADAGYCTLEQLKYFCVRTRQHRTGAKFRMLYSVYMELCNQLCPDRLFNLTAERQNRGQQYS
jgi:hypothetical protein